MTELKPYQIKGAKTIRAFKGRALLADEMGLGKTIQALYWCMKTTKARPILVICPASIKYNWQREANMHVGMTSEVLEGEKQPKGKKITNHPITIINYKILPFWLDYIERLDPKVVIIDEGHYIKHRGSGRSKNCKKLGRKSKHCIILTGTPLTSRPSELWHLLHILYPKLFSSFFSYAMKFCNAKKTFWGWQYKGAKNLGELHELLLETCMIRRLKVDVLKELPPKSRHIVIVDIEKPKEYKKAKNDFIGWLGKKSKAKAKKAERAKTLVKISYLKQLAAELKMKSVFNWVDNFLEQSDGKLIIFMKHKAIMKKLVDEYGKLSVRVDGSVTGRDRQVAVDLFQRSAKKRLFFGNIDAAGVGITLTAASTVLFIELDWAPGKHMQAEDRAHRIGQNDNVMIYYLIAKGTIEEEFCELLQKKQAVLDAVLDGSVNESDFDIYDELIKAL